MHLSRREFLQGAAAAASCALLARASAALPDSYANDSLLLDLERAACSFFFEQADPSTGMVKDRARDTGADTHTISSIAATGFGLSALCIAHANNFLKPADALARVRTTLEFVARRMPHEHG